MVANPMQIRMLDKRQKPFRYQQRSEEEVSLTDHKRGSRPQRKLVDCSLLSRRLSRLDELGKGTLFKPFPRF